MKNPRAAKTIGRLSVPLVGLLAFGCKDRVTEQPPDMRPVVTGSSFAPGDSEMQTESTIGPSGGAPPFSQVASAFVIENPDSEGTTVIYLFSSPVRCMDLSFTAWDRALADGTMILELKLFGKTPGGYAVVGSQTPSPREAAVEWERTAGKFPPTDARSSGGWVTLDAPSSRGLASGTFAVVLGSGRLNGTFHATSCPEGHEP
jgi:hypothetical protein